MTEQFIFDSLEAHPGKTQFTALWDTEPNIASKIKQVTFNAKFILGLLGMPIDHKLNFNEHICHLMQKVNNRVCDKKEVGTNSQFYDC